MTRISFCAILRWQGEGANEISLPCHWHSDRKEIVYPSQNPSSGLTSEEIRAVLLKQPGERVRFNVKKGEKAWNPSSTKAGREIHGPCRVDYILWEGSVEAFIAPLLPEPDYSHLKMLVTKEDVTEEILKCVENCVDWFDDEPTMGTQEFIDRLCKTYGGDDFDMGNYDNEAARYIMREARRIRKERNF